MNEQDTQTVERVAAAMADADAQVLENLQPHIAGAYRRRARAAISAMPDTKWQASDGDTRCQKCAVSNPVWHAPNKVWNRIVGGPDAIDDPAGVLCPNCFMAMSDEMWVVAPKAAMPDTTAQADTIKALTEALTECAEAFELHASAYPAMVKGYTLDALMTARTTLVAVAAAKETQ